MKPRVSYRSPLASVENPITDPSHKNPLHLSSSPNHHRRRRLQTPTPDPSKADAAPWRTPSRSKHPRRRSELLGGGRSPRSPRRTCSRRTSTRTSSGSVCRCLRKLQNTRLLSTTSIRPEMQTGSELADLRKRHIFGLQELMGNKRRQILHKLPITDGNRKHVKNLGIELDELEDELHQKIAKMERDTGVTYDAPDYFAKFPALKD